MRLNCFSSCFLLKDMQMGLPWGQYFKSSRLMTCCTRASSSFSSLYQPALMAALQATVCSSASRTVSGCSRRPDSRSEAMASTV